MSRFNTGNPIGSADPRDRDDNTKNLDVALNSQDPAFYDRLGKLRPTYKGAVDPTGLVQLAANEADRSKRIADGIETRADEIVQNATSQAAVEAGKAEAARDAAFVNADAYGDTSTGLAETSVGEQFQVVSGYDIVRYRHDAGPVAVEVARYPAAKPTYERLQLATDGRLKVAMPNAEFNLTSPSELVVDGRMRVVRAAKNNGAVSSVLRNGVGLRAYPYRSFSDKAAVANVAGNDGIIKQKTTRTEHGDITAYPYRSFHDRIRIGRVGYSGAVIDSPNLQVAQSQSGRMHVTVDGDKSDVTMIWQHGESEMLKVRYKPNGFNGLFNYRSCDIAPLGDIATAQWVSIQLVASDAWPPLVVAALGDGDGGGGIYTGGNHGSDGGSGGLNTARMSKIELRVDGRLIGAGERFEGYADCVEAKWTNELMANNTITLGRYVLAQEFISLMTAGDVSGFCAVTAYEPIKVNTDNGPQFFSTGYDSVHFYDGEQQSRVAIPQDATIVTSGLHSTYKSWATCFGSANNGFHGVWMDRQFEAGDGRYIGGSASLFRKGAGSKFYSATVGGGGLGATLNAGESYEWHGGYFWAPNDAISDGVDSALTFHRRGVPQLGYAMTEAGSGRVSLPAWASGREVIGVGVGGVKGVPVISAGYETNFSEIKG